MDTETKKSPKLAAIRTYAKDLDAERSHNPVTTSSPSVSIVKPQPTEPVVASDTLTAEINKVPTPEPKPIPKKPTPVPALKPITPTKQATIIVDNEDAAAATIITDTKRGEFKLIPAIITSIRGWFSAKKQNYEAKKIPKYTVPDSTRRKGIIQKATSKTGKFAAADFSSIQERILERKAAAAKKLVEKPSTTWTANTETGFTLLAETTTQPVSNVQVVARKSFRTTPEEIVVTSLEPTPEPVTEQKVIEPDDSRWASPAQPTISTNDIPVTLTAELPPETVSTPEELLTETVSAPIEEVVELPVTATPEEPAAQPTTEKVSRFNVLKINTNTLTIIIAGAVVALAILGATVYFIFYKEDVADSPTTIPDTLLLETEVRPLMLYTLSADAMIEAFTALRNERGTTQGVFMYTSTIGNPEIVLPTQILSVLSFALAPDLAQTIATARVGYINQAPYLLLKIKDQTAARGGLLMWEETMYQSLTPLFSLTPEVANDTFLDATISGTDVRVLKNASGAERLLYGITSGTIIITTNSASYAQLTTLIK